MRGWLHAVAFPISIALGAVAVGLAPTTRAKVAVIVYALSIAGLFGTSALYHRHMWSTSRSRTLMKRFDHSMIFVFIAGTYTPFALLAMPSNDTRIVLPVVWGGALLGIGLRMAWISSPRYLATPLYIALGWVAVIVMPALLHAAGVAPLVLLITGGVLYSLGGVVYAARRPDPAPATFGYHEVFHLLTIVAAICHYIAIMLVLANLR